jgi:MoaA/NifB/PqqE/SkfB family radical SAM enzyme
MSNENFCYHPWVGLDVNPQGNFKPCCKYAHNIATNLKDYLHSEELANLKTEFIKGNRPSACHKCWVDEDAGLVSKRILDHKIIFNRDIDTSTFKVLSIAFGNTCNLACVMCNSGASSRWAQEEKKLQKHGIDVAIASHKKFYKDDSFLKDLIEISSDLIDITFPGGEPFITGIAQQISYLDFLLENNPGNISLTYITNATTFPGDEFWHRWTKFKQVNIHMSIDSIGNKFEYIRWPADWNTCYNNIKQYQQAQKKYANLKLSVGHTVSIFNVFYLPEFFLWCLKEKLPHPHIHMVDSPEYYSINVLPLMIKEKIKEKLSRTSKFDGVIAYMNHSDNNSFEKTQQYIRFLDQHRNQSFGIIFPELIGLLI